MTKVVEVDLRIFSRTNGAKVQAGTLTFTSADDFLRWVQQQNESDHTVTILGVYYRHSPRKKPIQVIRQGGR